MWVVYNVKQPAFLCGEVSSELLVDAVHLLVQLIRDGTLVSDLLEDVSVVSLEEALETLLVCGDVADGDAIEETAHTSVHRDGLQLNRHGDELTLLQELSKFLTSVKKLLRGSIKI